jgi:hypothetical protein
LAGAGLCSEHALDTSQHGTGGTPARRAALIGLLKLMMRQKPWSGLGRIERAALIATARNGF